MLKLLAPLVLGLAVTAAPAEAVVVLTQSQSLDSGEVFARAGDVEQNADAAPIGSIFTATAVAVETDGDGPASASAALVYNSDFQRLSFSASTSSRLEDALARARATILINAANTGTDPFRLFLDVEIDGLALQFDDLISPVSNGQITITGDGLAVGENGKLILTRDVITKNLLDVDCDVSGLPGSASCIGGPQTLSFDLGLVLNPGSSTNRKIDTQLNLENLEFTDNTALFTGRLGGVRFSFRGVDLVTPPGVPEPATWAMVIVGFGLVGATARRRRSLEEPGALKVR